MSSPGNEGFAFNRAGRSVVMGLSETLRLGCVVQRFLFFYKF